MFPLSCQKLFCIFESCCTSLHPQLLGQYMLWTVHLVFIPIVDLAETPRISVSLQAGFLSWEWRHLGVDRRQGVRMWFARRAHKGQGLQPDPGTEEGLSDSHHVQMWPARTHSKGTMTQIALARPEFCEIHSTSRYYKDNEVLVSHSWNKCFLDPVHCHNHYGYTQTSLTYLPG